MALVLAAVVVAVPASTIAASGSTRSDDLVEVCVANQDVVHRLTNGVDTATSGLTTPLTAGLNTLVDGINQGTNGAVSDVTDSITPEGSARVVAPGAQCPDGYDPQLLSTMGPSEVVAAHSAKAVTLGHSKVDVADEMLPEEGDWAVTATVNVTEAGPSPVAQTIKCALVGAGGRTIPGTTSVGTLPAATTSTNLPISITADLANEPAGPLDVDCKDPTIPAGSTAASRRAGRTARRPTARAANKFPISKTQCQLSNGIVKNDKCEGGILNGSPISTAPPTPRPTATANVQSTRPSRSSAEIACTDTGGSVVDGKCKGGTFSGISVP